MRRIRHILLTRLFLAGAGLFAISSCSTPHMALNLRHNNIILVKAPPTSVTDPQKKIAATATASTDVYLMALPVKNSMAGLSTISVQHISEHAPAIPAGDFTDSKASTARTNQMPLLNYDSKTKALSKTIQIVQKISGKKNSPNDDPSQSHSDNDKDQIAAFLLCFFLGVLGIHRFYLGYIWQGVVQLLTAGGFGIWALIDFIRIITGDLKPKDGEYYRKL